MQTQHTILIVEDDQIGLETMSGYFEVEGYNVIPAQDATEAERGLSRHKIDLIVLDLRLPGKDGLTVLREIRERTDIPVIVVSARTEKVDHIVALEIGADDYLDKPVDMRELVVRARNLCRRLPRANAAEDKSGGTATMTFDGYALDRKQRRLIAPDGSDVPLTRAEFELLAYLVARPERVISRQQLQSRISKREWSPADRSVDVLIGRLRAKIEADPKSPRLIATVHGVGYSFLGASAAASV